MRINTSILVVLTIIGLTACKKQFYDEDVLVDPNGASVESVLNNATRGQISQLAVGVQSTMRNGILSYYRETGTVGREIIYSASTESRYFNELLGTQASQFSGTNDPAGIMNTYYLSYSSLRRRAEILLRSANNTTTLTDQEKAATRGFAKTFQAYATWVLVNMQGKNGIRETFSDLAAPGDLLKPGKFGTYESGLALAKTLINEGNTDLSGGGTAFPFTVTSGYNGFTTVADFKKFNRAIAARIFLYQKDWAGVLTALNESFLNLTGSLQAGPVMTFSTITNDQINPLYHVPNSSGAPFVAFNEFITDAEAGDTRVFGPTAKVTQRTSARTSGAVTSTHDVTLYASNTSSISIIRNEELVLMYAEAKIQLNQLADAIIALDKIRTTYGLRPLAIAKPTILADKNALIDEVLNQRRYSLFFEGQRWFDVLRYGKKNILPLQGTVGSSTFAVFDNFARPDAEVQWDKLNP
jgi:hypothetical protein